MNDAGRKTGGGEAAAGPPDKPQTTTYVYYVLVLLMIANMFKQIDRQVFSLLLEPIKADLHASDTQMSILAGFAFLVFYSVIGIPVARLSDRTVRRTLLAGAVALWSVMTAACGVAQGFVVMALARMGVGLGESAGAPASLSLIADYFEKSRRAQAMGFWRASEAAALMIGPAIVGLIATHYGWRAAFFVLGAPGLLLALLLVLTVREPRRGAFDPPGATATAGQGFWRSIGTLLRNRVFFWLFMSQVAVGMVNGFVGVWTPAFYMRVHQLSVVQFGAMVSPFYGLVGIVATILGGIWASQLVKRSGNDRWLVILPGITSLIAVPLSLGFSFSPGLAATIACGLTLFFFLSVRNGPTLALALDVAPPELRGLAGAMMLMGSMVIGGGLGPVIVGGISDMVTPVVGPREALRYAMGASSVFIALSALLTFLPLRHMRKTPEDGVGEVQ